MESESFTISHEVVDTESDSFEEGMKDLLTEGLKNLKNLPPVVYVKENSTLMQDPLFIRAQENPLLLTAEEELELLEKIRKSKENGI
jgi:hypothetical protein